MGMKGRVVTVARVSTLYCVLFSFSRTWISRRPLMHSELVLPQCVRGVVAKSSFLVMLR